MAKLVSLLMFFFASALVIENINAHPLIEQNNEQLAIICGMIIGLVCASLTYYAIRDPKVQ